jgi:hypothetical protein
MEIIRGNIQPGHFLIRNLDAFLVTALVKRGVDGQALARPGIGYQVDDGLQADQWASSPVLSDMAEHPMFDFVPLAGSRWQVTYAYDESAFIRESLELTFPQSGPISVAAASISGDHQFLGLGVSLPTHLIPPGGDGLHGKLSGIMVHSDTDPTLILTDIVNPVRNCFTEFLVLEIVATNLFWLPFGLPLPACVISR